MPGVQPGPQIQNRVNAIGNGGSDEIVNNPRANYDRPAADKRLLRKAADDPPALLAGELRRKRIMKH